MKFRYFLATKGAVVQKGGRYWDDPLPVARLQFTGITSATPNASVTYGQYFSAARRFLESDAGQAAMSKAFAHRWAMAVSGSDIDHIDIFLVKHGQYYHPARLDMTAKNRKLALVLNVAVSPEGCDCLFDDYQSIRKLQRLYPFDFLPRVFGQAACDSPTQGQPIRFALGQWLNNHHEFHLSPDAHRIVLWHADDGHTLLSEEKTREIYAQATRILTAYYNLKTFEHVFAWHHAAGDFIARIESEKVSVKLTTVRQYVPLVADVSNDAQSMFHALLLFLLNTSIRMRLDRCDGVGDFLWAGEMVIEGVVSGFWDGLRMQVCDGRIPDELIELFRVYFSRLSSADVHALLKAIADRTYARLPERRIVQNHLRPHAAALKNHMDAYRLPP